MQDVFSNASKDGAGLIKSLRDSADIKIREIEFAFEKETERLQQQHETEIRDIQDKQEKEFKIIIKQEVARIINRAQIEKKKLQLNVIESFCKIMITDALSELKTADWRRFKKFLVQAVLETLNNIKHKHVRIIFCADDNKNREVQEEIIQQNNENSGLIFETQSPGTGSGLIIEDLESGCIYNVSIKRIQHRKHVQLRRAVYHGVSMKT